MRAIAALALVTGCGFQVNGTAVPGDGRPDAPDTIDAPDAPLDGAPTCLDRWRDGTIRFQPPVPLSTVSSSSYDRDPYLTRDELTLFVSSGRGGADADIYVATRTAVMDDFPAPTRSTSASTGFADTKLSIMGNGQTAFLGRGRDSGNHNIDIVEATTSPQSTAVGQFGGFSTMHLGNINDGANQHDPFISADGLHLYLAPDGGGSSQRLVVATRATVGGNFGAPVRIDELFSDDGEGDPTLSDDERVIVFSSQRAAANGSGNLWFATRASATGAFAPPIAVPDVNTDAAEGDPHLSVDGCRLYFARYVPGSDWDLFVAEATTP